MSHNKMAKLLFPTSISIASRITDLFDFVWPTAAAMWNLRWQVEGFIAVSPAATGEILQNRFVDGSGIHGANIKRACLEKTWDEQQEQFARLLLFEFCSLFEAWSELILSDLSIKKITSKDFQFPSTTHKGKPYGIQKVIALINNEISTVFDKSIFASLNTNKKYGFTHLENLLVTYRFFKECRNDIIHNAGLASEKCKEAYDAFAVLGARDIGVKERPASNIVKKGDPIKLSLRGVVGFGDIVLRIITTLDVQFSRTKWAETAFINRIRQIKSLPIKLDKGKQPTGKVNGVLFEMGLPPVKSASSFSKWLENENIIVFG